MADKPTATTELERIYTIPLRKTKDLVRSRRADLAVRDVKRFLTRHMKSENIWLDQEVNSHLWSRGKYTIPSRIRVRATRFSDGVVEVTLPETTTTGSIRSEIAERREKAAETPVLKAPAAAEEVDEDGHSHPEGDQPLTVIDGIGPATAEKLEKADIHGVHDLAKADAAKLAETTGQPTEKVQAWIDAAKKADADREKGAEKPAAGDKPSEKATGEKKTE
jgi:large subunit ribosomal protein L31e